MNHSFFTTKPRVINTGNTVKRREMIWVNFGITELAETEADSQDRWRAVSDRLAVTGRSFDELLKVVDPAHLLHATVEEMEGLLSFFGMECEVDAWRKLIELQVKARDVSAEVNVFYYADTPMWYDKSTRLGLVNSISCEKALGRANTVLWHDNIEGGYIELDVNSALDMLARIEIYASECFGVTASYLRLVKEEVDLPNLKAVSQAITAHTELVVDGKTFAYPAPLHFG